MVSEMIQRHAGLYGPRMGRFASEIARILSSGDKEDGLSAFIQRNMAHDLGYDLVFEDAAENIIGILVGAGKGHTILLRTSISCDTQARHPETYRSFSDDLASQIYAGHILGELGLLHRGTVVISSSLVEDRFLGDESKVLIGKTLGKLGIHPGTVILPQRSLPAPANHTAGANPRGRSPAGAESERPLDTPVAGLLSRHLIYENTSSDGYEIQVIAYGPYGDGADGFSGRSIDIGHLVETASLTAVLAYGLLSSG